MLIRDFLIFFVHLLSASSSLLSQRSDFQTLLLAGFFTSIRKILLDSGKFIEHQKRLRYFLHIFVGVPSLSSNATCLEGAVPLEN